MRLRRIAPSSVDPSLFEVSARVKKAADVDYVRDQILETVKAFQDKPVDAAKLDAVRKRLRYELALQLDNSDAIAAHAGAATSHLRRTPETIESVSTTSTPR